jgi:hypothetical protein
MSCSFKNMSEPNKSMSEQNSRQWKTEDLQKHLSQISDDQ